MVVRRTAKVDDPCVAYGPDEVPVAVHNDADPRTWTYE